MTDRESIIAFIRQQPDRTSARDLEQMIGRGDDLKPATPPVTVADLLELNDLDLGALAQAADDSSADALCRTLDKNAERLEEFVRDECDKEPTKHLMTHSARVLATLGAKVRAGLLQKTRKPAEPRILQSHEDAPCGSLWARVSDGRLVMRKANGQGCNVPPVFAWHMRQWSWDADNLDDDFPARLVAEGLTEDECRELSGMSNSTLALAWCVARETSRHA